MSLISRVPGILVYFGDWAGSLHTLILIILSTSLCRSLGIPGFQSCMNKAEPGTKTYCHRPSSQCLGMSEVQKQGAQFSWGHGFSQTGSMKTLLLVDTWSCCWPHILSTAVLLPESTSRKDLHHSFPSLWDQGQMPQMASLSMAVPESRILSRTEHFSAALFWCLLTSSTSRRPVKS